MPAEKVYQGNQVEIYRMSPALYFRKSDLARGQCNNAYLVGDTGVGVVDVSSLEAAREYVDESMLLFHKPIRYIFLTHGDWDHMEGLPAFFDKDVTIYCSRRLFHTLNPVGKNYKATFVAVDGNMQLSLSGGLAVELFTLPDLTHSHWDLFIRIPSEKTLCTGDAVVEYQTLYYHNANAETWIDSLRKLAAIDDLYVIPGHGFIYPYAYVGEVADFIEIVLRGARYCFQQFGSDGLAGISADKVNAVVDAYFSADSDDTRTLVEKAGAADAKREVRMVLWSLIRPELR